MSSGDVIIGLIIGLFIGIMCSIYLLPLILEGETKEIKSYCSSIYNSTSNSNNDIYKYADCTSNPEYYGWRK